MVAYYIESGIPVIAIMGDNTGRHAIVIIGHELDLVADLAKVKKRSINYPAETIEYIDYTDVPKKYVVNDDNLAPYRKINLSDPAEHYEGNEDFDDFVIKSVIVPLYKKIYLEVNKANELALAILSDIDFGFTFQSVFVFRFFLTSGRSFKEKIPSFLRAIPIRSL